ncbi:hypothetical protein VTL71DRAFT_10138 [Oculimacula yallundae]|uniref:Uncharacterized protein n=1 Tax=Oculimacula yallundae TaxID=86028 RepID=A0ABR4BPP6_9HELO
MPKCPENHFYICAALYLDFVNCSFILVKQTIVLIMKLLYLSTFACAASAAIVDKRAVANNNCGRAVAGTAKGAAFQSSAKADCSSNVVVRTTVLVTPSVSTVFQTSVAQATLQSTLLATSTSTSLATVTSFTAQTEISFATQYSTVVQDTTQTNQIPYTATTTSTATSTLTFGAASTVTIYTSAFAPVKRAAQTIPAYASACRSFEEYGSACSVVGVAPGPTTIYSTLPASTATSIISQTSTATSFVTSTVVSGVDVIVSEASTKTTIQTVTTTLAVTTTNAQTAFSTATIGISTVVETSTIEVPAAAQTVFLPIPTFKVQMQREAGGPNLFMKIRANDIASIDGTADSSAATTFTINSNSEMYAISNGRFICGSVGRAGNYINLVSRSIIANFPTYYQPMACSIVGAMHELVCQFGDTHNFTIYNNQFFYSVPDYQRNPNYRGFIVPV